jgi:hypothetical protein
MAGIHRSVEIIHRRPGASIINYKVRSSKSGNLSVSVKMRTSSLPTVVTARLFADEQITADGDWKAAPNELWSQQQFSIEMDTTDHASNAGEIMQVMPEKWTLLHRLNSQVRSKTFNNGRQKHRTCIRSS